MKKMTAYMLVGGFLLFAVASAFVTPPKTLKVDVKSTTMEWKAKKVTGSHNGFVSVSAGQIVLDGVNVTSGTFDIDMSSMTVEDIKDEGSNKKLLGHLQSDDFFSTAKHPTSKFVLTSVSQKSGKTYTVNGNLTIKDITKAISFPAEITISGNTLKAVAAIKVDRTLFDIRYRSTNFFENLGDKAIYDDFELNLNLVASL